MSIDNTVAILVTKTKKGTLEFRVKEIQAAENIVYKPDTQNGFNEKVVKNLFGDCTIFSVESDAWKEAFRIERKSGVVEYGVVPFRFPDLLFPA